jgi:hypothetical protein
VDVSPAFSFLTQEKTMTLSVAEKDEIFSRPLVVLVPGVSDLRVLRSAAGYYVGRTLEDMPYSRESGYFKTEAKAAEALAYVRIVAIPDEWPEDEM